MAKKEVVTLFVLGLLLVSLAVVAIYQPAQVSLPAVALRSDTSPEELLSCPAYWDAVGGFYAIETGVRPEETVTADQARWDARGELYLNQRLMVGT